MTIASKRKSRWTMWSAFIPLAMVLFGAGFAIEPDAASLYLYIAGVLCAGAAVVKLIVKDVFPHDILSGEHREDDEDRGTAPTR